MEGAGGQGSGRRLKPAPNVVTLGLASNTPRRRPLNTWGPTSVLLTFAHFTWGIAGRAEEKQLSALRSRGSRGKKRKPRRSRGALNRSQ